MDVGSFHPSLTLLTRRRQEASGRYAIAFPFSLHSSLIRRDRVAPLRGSCLRRVWLENEVSVVNGTERLSLIPYVPRFPFYSLHTRLRHVREERGGHDKRRTDGRRHVDGRNEG